MIYACKYAYIHTRAASTSLSYYNAFGKMGVVWYTLLRDNPQEQLRPQLDDLYSTVYVHNASSDYMYEY